MSIDLNKLANKLDEALSNETTETLTKFLKDKRMSNNKQPNTYAVTGVDHGSIVTASDVKEAIDIFQKVYNGEEIICVKNISDYNLENL